MTETLSSKVNSYLTRIAPQRDASSVISSLVAIERERGLIEECPRTWALACEVLGSEGGRDITKPQIAVGLALRQGIKHLRQARRPVIGGNSLGRAFASLDISGTTLDSRVNAISRTHDLRELDHHIGVLVSLMDGNGSNKFIPVDYGSLAADLLAWQDLQKRPGVVARWARDTYRKATPLA